MGSSTAKPRKKKPTPTHYVSWFEIPALHLDRAVAFYNAIFGISMEILASDAYQMALFPSADGNGGAVVVGQGMMPSDRGTLLYLNGGKDLNIVLGRVESAGGRVVMEKTLISDEAGYFAIFIDTEGNKLALHSGS